MRTTPGFRYGKIKSQELQIGAHDFDDQLPSYSFNGLALSG